MNNSFSTKRFGYLLREIFVEKKVLFLGIVVALLLYQFLGTKSLESFKLLNDYISFRRFLVFSGSIVCIVIIASSLGKRFQASANGLRNFMLPASRFEKWFSIGCIVLLFLFVHGVLFAAVDAVLIANIKADILALKISEAEKTKRLSGLYAYDLTGNISLANAGTMLMLASILLVGTTYFKKNQVVFTFISVVGIVALLFLINWGTAYLTFGNIATFDKLNPFSSADFTFQIEGSERVNEIHLEHSNASNVLVYVAYPALAIILFIVYYFRLKETEI